MDPEAKDIEGIPPIELGLQGRAEHWLAFQISCVFWRLHHYGIWRLMSQLCPPREKKKNLLLNDNFSSSGDISLKVKGTGCIVEISKRQQRVADVWDVASLGAFYQQQPLQLSGVIFVERDFAWRRDEKFILFALCLYLPVCLLCCPCNASSQWNQCSTERKALIRWI